MSDYTINDAVRDTLDMTPIPTTLSSSDIVNSVTLMMGREPIGKAELGTLRCEVIRNGHGHKTDKTPPRMRLLFAWTKEGGLCPAEIWAKAGGDPAKRKRGYYVRIAPSPELIYWWRKPTDSERAETEGPDSFGRPRTGIPDDVLDARLAALATDGRVSLDAIIKEFAVLGSTPRDQRARARTYGNQTGRFQSVGDGWYFDVTNPNTPRAVLDELRSRIFDSARAYIWRMNKKLLLLERAGEPPSSIELSFEGLYRDKGADK